MATIPQARLAELPVEEPEIRFDIPVTREERTRFTPEYLQSIQPEINPARSELGAVADEIERQIAPQDLPFARQAVDDLREKAKVLEAFEPAPDRVQMLTRGRELNEQEQFTPGDSSSKWTLQQFSTNPAGEPWLALREQEESGYVRSFTGTRAEMQKLVDDNGLQVAELPAITEGQYYREALGSMGLEPDIRREESLGLSV